MYSCSCVLRCPPTVPFNLSALVPVFRISAHDLCAIGSILLPAHTGGPSVVFISFGMLWCMCPRLLRSHGRLWQKFQFQGMHTAWIILALNAYRPSSAQGCSSLPAGFRQNHGILNASQNARMTWIYLASSAHRLSDIFFFLLHVLVSAPKAAQISMRLHR